LIVNTPLFSFSPNSSSCSLIRDPLLRGLGPVQSTLSFPSFRTSSPFQPAPSNSVLSLSSLFFFRRAFQRLCPPIPFILLRPRLPTSPCALRRKFPQLIFFIVLPGGVDFVKRTPFAASLSSPQVFCRRQRSSLEIWFLIILVFRVFSILTTFELSHSFFLHAAGTAAEVVFVLFRTNARGLTRDIAGA